MPSDHPAWSVDLVIISAIGGELAVLLRQGAPAGDANRRRGHRVRGHELPWAAAGPSVRSAAQRLASLATGIRAPEVHLGGVYEAGLRHPSGLPLSIAFRVIVPGPAAASASARTDAGVWAPVARLPGLAARQQAMVEETVAALRGRSAGKPAAFQLLPEEFTLRELQQAYELLLGRTLHKASFRRALLGAKLVKAGTGWRGEGRGRPAQLFRYAPARARPHTRGVDFEGGRI